MKIRKYSEYISEKLELLLEANMNFSDDFLAVVASIDNPLSEKILKLYKKDVDIDTNYIELSDKDNFVLFKSDKKVGETCIIVNPGATYDVLSAELFPSFRRIFNHGFTNYIAPNQSARIIEKLSLDDPRLGGLRFNDSLYHIRWRCDFNNLEYDAIMDYRAFRKGGSVKHQEIRIGTFVQNLLKKSGEVVDSKELEDFVIKFGTESRSRRENIFRDFDIVKGEDIRKYYLVDNYNSEEHTLGSSCMRYERCQQYLDIYVENSNVSLVILRSGDKIKGRAILWMDPVYDLEEYNGKPFMDRIYVNDHKDVDLFIKFAISKGFVYKQNQNFSKQNFMFDNLLTEIKKIKINLEKTSFDTYPYVDTLSYFDGKRILCNLDLDCYTLDSTDGSLEEPCDVCDGSGTIECPECFGGGARTCGRCDGEGDVDCSNCGGDGKEECPSCGGRGLDDEEGECSECEGTGEINCGRCDGEGTNTCGRCDGNGDVECGFCGGERVGCPECS